MKKSLSHWHYFQIILKAEFVFLLAVVVKILWFKYGIADFTLEQVQQSVPLSLYSTLNMVNIPKWGLYPLQIINVFEILYWIILVYLIDKATDLKVGFKIVASSYGPALFIWVIFIMFLTLNIS